jgi:mono/diheme cytochrome c family protein
MKIHPVYIMTAPVLVLVSSVQYEASGQQVQPVQPSAARSLFLRNCAHCHGADAHGDEGPDLHGIGWTDEQIANRVRNGKAGQMTAFAGKLQTAEIDALVAYVQSLK